MLTEESEKELESLRAEVERLRVANVELIQKASKRKDEIESLTAQLTEAKSSLSANDAELQRLTVELPKQNFAETIAVYPEVFLDVLQKQFRIEMQNGSLSFLTKEGKPVRDGKGNVIPFEVKAISDYLSTLRDNNGKNVFNALLKAGLASGGSVSTPARAQAPAKPVMPNFGLR